MHLFMYIYINIYILSKTYLLECFDILWYINAALWKCRGRRLQGSVKGLQDVRPMCQCRVSAQWAGFVLSSEWCGGLGEWMGGENNYLWLQRMSSDVGWTGNLSCFNMCLLDFHKQSNFLLLGGILWLSCWVLQVSLAKLAYKFDCEFTDGTSLFCVFRPSLSCQWDWGCVLCPSLLNSYSSVTLAHIKTLFCRLAETHRQGWVYLGLADKKEEA